METKSSLLLLKFGKQIRKYRLSKNLSQEGLASLADLHWTYISGIERGIRNISLKNIAKISKALKIELKNLFDF
ncbi:transcriptional regulator [Candidatus Roizmanbacteria bacterium CG10_big_fil_rev_8_21_14_0_10_36_26]|uniref:Transcriptional regulator n=1 Tax=Candidatus Roizmanbacteria bacterium CG10_big_fil_rev_8_21_14_0_10_36_26 TaxID=1974851 RepID=A0A2M8KLL9_9BACT|nr:MAG: transcriptional regulator [Candidatus Roizmanbacteria bacterium CG10_big_fil_rev_8_21_14_0_10_36_26]